MKAYDERLSIHDLRVVPGDTHTHVMLDLVVPHHYDVDQDKLLNYVVEKVKEKNQTYICVIKVDQSYV